MAKTKRPAKLLKLTEAEARLQLQQLAQEARLLIDRFPKLHDSFDNDELPVNFIIARGSGALKKRGSRKRPVRRD